MTQRTEPTPHAPTKPTTLAPDDRLRARRPADRALAIEGRNIHMLGMGGCGMSGLARLLRARGGLVSGSDMQDSPFTGALAGEGFDIVIGDENLPLPDQCDLVVASAAVKPDHPQLLDADRRGIPHLSYAEALGRSMDGTSGVAIAGTHGKSTTSAMLTWALSEGGLDPSAIIGAVCPQLAGGFRLGAPTIRGGARAGRAGLLIAEACEYNRSFHNFRPTIAAITSVEADHLDIYGSLDAVVKSFHEFAELVRPADEGGYLLIAHDGAHRREVAAGATCTVETIGYSPAADWCVGYDQSNRRIEVRHAGKAVGAWPASMPGAHNAMNAATAFALACIAGADPAPIADALGRFAGVERRCQMLGERPIPGGAVRVYDDYGHHPTEIEETLKALREFERPEESGGRLICVFQPHQHSRTRFLLEEFASAFSHADVVIVPHIYFVRDSIAEKQSVSAADLVDRLRAARVQAMHLYPFEAIIEQLEVICRPNDLLAVMGAGPVFKVGHGFLSAGRSAT